MNELFAKFKKNLVGQWDQQKIVVAVSGGVDSMVLLDLLQRVSSARKLQLVVAHVNHQLREESIAEADYLRQYCSQAGLAFFETVWENPPHTGIEAAAREFRYAFFEQVLKETDSQLLMTAHHGDDLAETVLMKLTRGGQLANLIGIKAQQDFGTGLLVRPLLPFTKAALREYANERNLIFFEDASNHSLDYQRNRLRQQVMPLLVAENPQAIQHINQFSQKISWAENLIEAEMQRLFTTLVIQKSAEHFELDVTEFSLLSEAQQGLFWDYFFEQLRRLTGVTGNNRQIAQLQELLKDADHTQWQLAFAAGFHMQLRYQKLIFAKAQAEQPAVTPQIVTATGSFVTPAAWLALFPSDSPPYEPEETSGWQIWQREFSYYPAAQFTVRPREAGDYLQLSETLRKKVRRYLIDQKIPLEKRAQLLVVESDGNELVALVPHVISYLSIAKETDTIHYTLLYKTRN